MFCLLTSKVNAVEIFECLNVEEENLRKKIALLFVQLSGLRDARFPLNVIKTSVLTANCLHPCHKCACGCYSDLKSLCILNVFTCINRKWTVLILLEHWQKSKVGALSVYVWGHRKAMYFFLYFFPLMASCIYIIFAVPLSNDHNDRLAADDCVVPTQCSQH